MYSSGEAEVLEKKNDIYDLKVGMMPAVNSIPLIVADKAGFFIQEGVSVDLVMFTSQLNRESALQTHRVDGTISDLINAIQGISNNLQVKVTSRSSGMFSLLTSPSSDITSINDWTSAGKAVKTGLLENSIIYYVTEKMLLLNNADPAAIDLVNTVNVPGRLEMLLANKIEAACLPEPVARVAVLRGAHTIADTRTMSHTPGILLFTQKAIDNKAEKIAAFYRAYNKAVEILNKDEYAYRDQVIERGKFPEIVKDDMILPRYTKAAIPSAGEVDEVVNWMLKTGLISRPPEYSRLIDSSFIP